MASDPAVPLHGSGPDAAIASAPEPRRRRWFAVRAPAGEAIRTLRLLLLGSMLAPLLVLLGAARTQDAEQGNIHRTEPKHPLVMPESRVRAPGSTAAGSIQTIASDSRCRNPSAPPA